MSRRKTVATPSSNQQLVAVNPTTYSGTRLSISFAQILNQSISADGLTDGKNVLEVTSVAFEVTATYVNDGINPFTLLSSWDLLLSYFGGGLQWKILDAQLGNAVRVGPQELPSAAVIIREFMLKGKNAQPPIILEVDGVPYIGPTAGTGAPSFTTYAGGYPETFMTDDGDVGGHAITWGDAESRTIRWFWEWEMSTPKFVTQDKDIGPIHESALPNHQLTFSSRSLADDGDRPFGTPVLPFHLRLASQDTNIWLRYRTVPESKEQLHHPFRDESYQLANMSRSFSRDLDGGTLVHAWYFMREYLNLNGTDPAAIVPFYTLLRASRLGAVGFSIPNLWSDYRQLQVPLAHMPQDDVKLSFAQQALMHLNRLEIDDPLRYFASVGYIIPLIYPERAGWKSKTLATSFLRVDFSDVSNPTQYDHLVIHGEGEASGEAASIGLDVVEMKKLDRRGVIPGQLNSGTQYSSNRGKPLVGPIALRGRKMAKVAADIEAPQAGKGVKVMKKRFSDY